MFPYNTIEGPIISAPIKFYPSYSLDKLDDYSRSIITFRLCRYFQEHIPEIEDLIVISYAFFLIRFLTLTLTTLLVKDLGFPPLEQN